MRLVVMTSLCDGCGKVFAADRFTLTREQMCPMPTTSAAYGHDLCVECTALVDSFVLGLREKTTLNIFNAYTEGTERA